MKPDSSLELWKWLNASMAGLGEIAERKQKTTDEIQLDMIRDLGISFSIWKWQFSKTYRLNFDTEIIKIWVGPITTTTWCKKIAKTLQARGQWYKNSGSAAVQQSSQHPEVTGSDPAASACNGFEKIAKQFKLIQVKHLSGAPLYGRLLSITTNTWLGSWPYPQTLD